MRHTGFIYIAFALFMVLGCGKIAQPGTDAVVEESEKDCWRVDIAGMDFSVDKVWRVRDSSGSELALVTREYLGEALGRQAVLVYLRKADGSWNTDSIFVAAVTLVEKGLKYIEPEECVSGGTLKYYPADNAYFYNDVALSREAALGTVYIKLAEDGSTFVKTASNSMAAARLSPMRMSLDGYDYPLVKIAGYLWTAENIKAGRYADSKPIPSEGRWSAHVPNWGESSAKGAGRLYNAYSLGFTADDEEGTEIVSPLAPEGWRLPSAGVGSDWEALAGFAGGSSALRKTGTDVTGFSIVPFGRITSAGSVQEAQTDDHIFWSSTSAGGTKASIAKIYYKTSGDLVQYMSSTDKRSGFGVRLTKTFK